MFIEDVANGYQVIWIKRIFRQLPIAYEGIGKIA